MLPWKLAVRFLKSGRLQTMLIVIGISIAIAVQIFIGLLMGSLQKNFVDRTLGSSADITIESAASPPSPPSSTGRPVSVGKTPSSTT